MAVDFAPPLSHQQKSGQITTSASTKGRTLGNVTAITTAGLIFPNTELEVAGSHI
jgi:hypothetical protein